MTRHEDGMLTVFADTIFGTGKNAWMYHVGFFLSGMSFLIISMIVVLGLSTVSSTNNYTPPSIIFGIWTLWSFLPVILIVYSVGGIVYTGLRINHDS